MAYDLQEQDQIDALKAFWDRWGNTILAVLTVVALAVAGWRAWQWYTEKQSIEAAGLYEALRGASTKRDMARVTDAQKQLAEKYASTAYAGMGALLAAKAQFEHGDTKAARAALQWAIDSAKDETVRLTARLRMAGLMLDEKAHDEGLKLLSIDVPPRYVAAYADRRGDLLLAAGKTEDARAAFKQALEKAGERDPLKDLVRVKLDALGGAS